MGLSRRPWIHIHLINDKTDFWGDPVAQMVAGMLIVILFPALRHIAVSISAISFDSLWHKNTSNYRARWNLERYQISKWILIILSGTSLALRFLFLYGYSYVVKRISCIAVC